VLIKKGEVEKLSDDIRKIIDGQEIDLRDNKEGSWSILKNDIHTLASLKNQQVITLQQESNLMRDTLENISHQLKTPLTSMMIMADLLTNAPVDKQEEFLNNIKNGLVHTDWLVSSLLKMAKLDAKAVSFSPSNFSAKELLEQALEPLQVLLEIKEQELEVLGNLNLLFYCDLGWTKEALTNILKNAMEHSPSHSSIQIKFEENPICKWISITDSGKGIPPTRIKGLFQRFATEINKKGYGIGLPLALAIMNGQNGAIEVDGGGNGKGATFTLKFYAHEDRLPPLPQTGAHIL
jgi:K+-sensing histidine kinase KdpD